MLLTQSSAREAEQVKMKRAYQGLITDDDDGGDYRSYGKPNLFVFARQRRSSTASSRTLSLEPSKQSLKATQPREPTNPNPPNLARASTHKSAIHRTASTAHCDIGTLFSARECKAESSEARKQKRRAVERAAPQTVIDLEDDENDIPVFDPKEDEIIDLEDIEFKLEEEMYRPGPSRSEKKADQAIALLPRNPPVDLPWVLIDSCAWKSSHLKEGKTVELADKRFLHITAVIQNVQTDIIFLKGLLLKRARDVANMLPRKLNELCFIFEVDQDDTRSPREQSIIDFHPEDVLKIRKLICTNRPFPECRFDKLSIPAQHDSAGNIDTKATLKYVEDFETLVVRWKFTSFYKTAAARLNFAGLQINFEQQKLESLSPIECSPDLSIPSYVQRWNWRGETVLGGSGPDRRDNQGRRSPKKVSIIELPDSGDEAIASKIARQQRNPLTECNWLNVIRPGDLGTKDKDGNIESLHCRLNSTLKMKTQPRRGKEGEVWIIENENSNFKSSLRAVSGGDRGSRPPRYRPGEAAPQGNTTRAAVLRYTFGDAFCGAGGMTRGAVMAGLKVDWGFDFSANAAETWRFNFPNSKLFEMWANEFAVLPDPDRSLLVDILHLSPPCQVFSPMKVHAGKNDEMNFASLFAVRELLEKTKPRIVTLEQTFGILYKKYKFAFEALIHMFTDHGFSVSWQVVKFQEWGLAQSRRRLIIVAACPGETLPDLPPSTHAESGVNGLKPYTSIRSVLSAIPANAPNHETDRVRSGFYLPWDDSTITTCCMTSGVMGRGHPSGERGLTQREFAAIQSFPLTHIFVAKEIRRQIGNAVPPQIAAIILRAVKRHLERVDKAELEKQRVVV